MIVRPLFAGGRGGDQPPSRLESTDPFSTASLELSVLIVEDEMIIAWTLQDMVAEIGFTDIRIAANCVDAVRAAEERTPGLLICDINLGGGPDGLATAARLSSIAPMRVLFITGYASDEIREEVEEACPGAPLLRKPIVPLVLERCLREMLAGGA